MLITLILQRKTGGVRCIEKSEFLEDVYTMNDFIYNNDEIVIREPQDVTGLQNDVPYLITEFCGHMFPTKRFDQQERLVEHALRHLSVQNLVRLHDEYCGRNRLVRF